MKGVEEENPKRVFKNERYLGNMFKVGTKVEDVCLAVYHKVVGVFRILNMTFLLMARYLYNITSLIE